MQEAEKYRDEDEANESKYEAENGQEKYRVTVCNTLTEGNRRRISRAVTDTDEDMVRILITDDSQAKLNVVLQLERSSVALTSFLLMEFVMQWACSPTWIGVCVCTDDCVVVGGHSCCPHESCVDYHIDYS